MEELLKSLRKFDALRDDPAGENVDHISTRVMPAHPPQYAPEDFMESLSDALRYGLEQLGIEKCYAHQAEAIESILSGEDVVLEAPTASGKTLCFNIPLVEMLSENRGAKALMIHPMKALSNDQRRQLEALSKAVESKGGKKIESWVFDGDTDKAYRKIIKQTPPDVLMTNPEMLHLSFLGWEKQWINYLSSIKMIVIDEIHEYRGYFGTNVSLLFRRFLAKLRQLGTNPKIVLATATCANAEEHAYRLTGRRCKLIRSNLPMRAERHFAFIDPDIPSFSFPKIFPLRIARAALACESHGLSTIIFCNSRRFAEEASIQAKKDTKKLGIDPECIAPYRSGYETSLRRDIEEGLRNGKYRAVFSTNALEIGMDIGLVDACILAGFPDNVLAAWQRIGRAGRSWQKKAFVLFYALNNPFDKFFANNIDAFLNKNLDEILISIDNEELMKKHIPFLLTETGGILNEEHRKDIGDAFLNFSLKETAGLKTVSRYKPSYQQLNIRGAGGSTYELIYDKKSIGSISSIHLFREAYLGAVYNHFGRSYLVAAHSADEVHLEDIDQHLRTEGSFFKTIQTDEILSGRRYSENISTYYGKLTVFENFTGYRLVDTRSDKVLKTKSSEQARSLKARGFWMDIENISAIGSPNSSEYLYGVEQLFRIGLPFIVPCDRHDLETLSTSNSPLRIYLYETLPGGIGVAEKALELCVNILDTGIKIAENCGCKNGCPSCIVPPRGKGDSEKLKKADSIPLAHAIIDTISNGSQEVFDAGVFLWRSVK